MSAIRSLLEEQQELQLGPDKEKHTNRGRLLEEYSRIFRLGGTGFEDLLHEVEKHSKGDVLWVDWGCGIAVAQRQLQYKHANNPHTRIHTLGIDALPATQEEIEHNAMLLKNLVTDEIFQPRYSPQFVEGDISVFRPPRQADVSTLCEVLFWTRDPIAVMCNVMANTKVGGVVCMSGLDRIHVRAPTEWGGDDGRFFRKTTFRDGLRGFDPINGLERFNDYPDAVVLLKETDASTPEEIEKLIFEKNPVLKSTAHLRTGQGYMYFYDYPH